MVAISLNQKITSVQSLNKSTKCYLNIFAQSKTRHFLAINSSKIFLILFSRLFRFYLFRFAPTLAADLIAAAEDARSTVMSEDVSFSLPDTFIRPFREEVDSRNEYKTQVSGV